MDKLLRNAPTISVVVVLAIQLTRVAEFGVRIGAGWLAWVYAVFLAFSIYSLSYWTGRLYYEVTADPKKEEDRRKYSQQARIAKLYERARFTSSVWLILFIGIDGWLNLAETMAALPADVLAWERTGAVVYGIFPTLAAFGLGTLQSMIDKIPAGASKPSLAGKVADKLLARLGEDDKPLAQDASKGDKQGASLQAQVAGEGARVAGKRDKPLLSDETLLAYLAQHPQASDGEAARHFGRSRQAIQQRRKRLIERGAMAEQFAVHREQSEVGS